MELTDKELNDFKRLYEERWARWNGRIVIIERIFRGTGVHHNILRAKVIDGTKIKYLNFNDISPF